MQRILPVCLILDLSRFFDLCLNIVLIVKAALVGVSVKARRAREKYMKDNFIYIYYQPAPDLPTIPIFSLGFASKVTPERAKGASLR